MTEVTKHTAQSFGIWFSVFVLHLPIPHKTLYLSQCGLMNYNVAGGQKGDLKHSLALKEQNSHMVPKYESQYEIKGINIKSTANPIKIKITSANVVSFFIIYYSPFLLIFL